MPDSAPDRCLFEKCARRAVSLKLARTQRPFCLSCVSAGMKIRCSQKISRRCAMLRHEKNGNMRPKRGKSAEKIHIGTDREPFFAGSASRRWKKACQSAACSLNGDSAILSSEPGESDFPPTRAEPDRPGHERAERLISGILSDCPKGRSLKSIPR